MAAADPNLADVSGHLRLPPVRAAVAGRPDEDAGTPPRHSRMAGQRVDGRDHVRSLRRREVEARPIHAPAAATVVADRWVDDAEQTIAIGQAVHDLAARNRSRPDLVGAQGRSKPAGREDDTRTGPLPPGLEHMWKPDARWRDVVMHEGRPRRVRTGTASRQDHEDSCDAQAGHEPTLVPNQCGQAAAM